MPKATCPAWATAPNALGHLGHLETSLVIIYTLRSTNIATQAAGSAPPDGTTCLKIRQLALNG